MNIGLIGIVKDDLENDFFGTVVRLREIGYEGIEHGEGLLKKLDVDGSEFKGRMSEIGMSSIAYHTTKYSFQDGNEALLDEAESMGVERVCMAWGPAESSAEISEDAELYNKIGQACVDRGMMLTYHNHDHEFAHPSDCSMSYLDMLMSATNPELVHLHLDVAWCLFGGQDPVEYIKRYSRRISVLHMKDLKRLEEGCSEAKGDRESAQFTEVGEGIVPVDSILDAAKTCNASWLVVEQDRLGDLPAWESVSLSFENLKSKALEKQLTRSMV
ncbi:sugar phosphate isomerase/epimerase family protein [Pelagicoccus mobilis]|uniref:Sugar phosphate isomerase/epimerase n=1 Tax=Pelagicoccus mobilis TaxID=415221 RepID=A0A934S3C9_9BACT|nr:sugar phosphate isomerase/epimerase [Pelagicoccus mobilis]MBK1880440.1 sugar phosphate isomerase/epimerase [Pelagicoccus mobilis]